MMARRIDKAWAVVYVRSGKPVVVSGQVPIFWRRHVAKDFCRERGLDCGWTSKPFVRIQRIALVVE